MTSTTVISKRKERGRAVYDDTLLPHNKTGWIVFVLAFVAMIFIDLKAYQYAFAHGPAGLASWQRLQMLATVAGALVAVIWLLYLMSGYRIVLYDRDNPRKRRRLDETQVPYYLSQGRTVGRDHNWFGFVYKASRPAWLLVLVFQLVRLCFPQLGW